MVLHIQIKILLINIMIWTNYILTVMEILSLNKNIIDTRFKGHILYGGYGSGSSYKDLSWFEKNTDCKLKSM